MGFWDSLTGSSQRKDMMRGAEAANRHSRLAQSHVSKYGERAKNYLTPYQQQGDRAHTMYSNALGVNGNDAQNGYWDNYQADPQRVYDENRAVDSVNRSMAARGMSQSGFGALAGARAGMDAGRSYTQERLNRLQGLGGQGLGIAGQMGQIDMNTGQQMAGLEMNQGQNLQGMYRGLSSTRNMGFNNALALGGLAVNAFAPGMGGTSAAGNMLGGMNRLWD